MRAYKHWDAQFAADLVDRGRIRLMPLSHYTRIETDRPGVQDDFENAIRVGQRGVLGGPGLVAPDQREAMARLGIKIAPGVTNVVVEGNAALHRGEDVYVFCLTEEREPGLFKATDAVTEIPDVALFGEAIVAASNGKFRGMDFQKVSYSGADRYAEDGPFGRPSPFVKRPEYGGQREVRIALFLARSLREPIFLESDLLKQALRGREPR